MALMMESSLERSPSVEVRSGISKLQLGGSLPGSGREVAGAAAQLVRCLKLRCSLAAPLPILALAPGSG